MEKFEVNKNVCIGCGACTAVAPSTFQFGEDGLAETIEGKKEKEKLSEEELNEAMDALEGCPVSAITLENENSN